ncbi:MAG: GNAT family N-acetyltransferase [Sandarakinorhabdus sp.]|jgi:RimJ/RimL family protein N-acetyltransferase|nr:GNAT family N-acetyltransferase [Sandarakinorhabdus sp.]
MSAPPLTVLAVPEHEAAVIRAAVRAADVALLGPGYRLAVADDVPGLLDLLSDPAVSAPIYDLPRPFTAAVIGSWVAEAQARQARGEAVLAVSVDADGRLSGYSYFTVWPERSAAEIGGAQRADRQNQGVGKAGAARSFGWMFEHLGVRLIGLTAAIDNVRSARVIEAAGFVAMGERESRRPDGSVRLSRYWELTRDQWRAQQAAAP